MTEKPKPSSRPHSRRQSHRVKKPRGTGSQLLTPRQSASPSPAHSRPATPVTAIEQNRCTSTPINTAYTTAPTSSSSTNPRQPTINWDCVSHVISDQKIHSTYEKPTIAPGTTTVTTYGRVITTTTTTTITTTIATTEILHPDETGYEESLARQKAQMEASPEEREQLEKRCRESRTWSRGDRVGHEYFHQRHHRAAKPSRAVFTTA